jgi:hypothetical protein
MCSMSRDPRRDEYTICTAVTRDAVFTVRTYRTRPLYDPGLVANPLPPRRVPAGQRDAPPFSVKSWPKSGNTVKAAPWPDKKSAIGRYQQALLPRGTDEALDVVA